MDIRATDSAYLRFLGTGAFSLESVRPARKAYIYQELKEWDLADNYLATNARNNIYNWVFFHPKWKSDSISGRSRSDIGKIAETFDFVDKAAVRRFMSYYPGFYKVLNTVFSEALKVFKIVGKPVINAVTDPETGGDFHLIVYFPVDNRSVEEINKLIAFRKRIRGSLPDKDRLLINCFLK